MKEISTLHYCCSTLKKKKNDKKNKDNEMAEAETVKITETTKEYELLKADLVPDRGDEAPTRANIIAGMLDKFRVIPRLLMLSYCWAFYASVSWFMSLAAPTNAQAMFISTIVGAGAAFFGLYVGKPGASLPKGNK